LLARLRSKAEQHAARPVSIEVIQEAGLDGFWVHRLLEANGVASHVVNPASIAVPRRRRRAKTDGIDGETWDCIRLRFSSGALVAWTFERSNETVTVDPPGRLIIGVDAAAAAIELACQGHGVISTFENWLRPFLETGALRPVLPDWWTRFEGPRLYFSNRFMPAPLRAFVDLIAEIRMRSTDTQQLTVYPP